VADTPEFDDLYDVFDELAEPLNAPAKSEKAVKPVTKKQVTKPQVKPKKKTALKKTEAAEGKQNKQKKVGNLGDDRKLTTKGKSTLRSRWSVENSGKSRDVLMTGLLGAARDKFGTDRVFGSREELGQLAIGIPTPSLAFEYLIANDIFPLSSVMMLAGSWGSCKSALSYEFFRWFYELSGIAVHIDTEDKFDADFACDIMRVPHDQTPIISNRANSVEQMQQILTHYVKELQKMLIGTKEDPGPGKIVPCVLSIDSLAGASSEENQEKIMKVGNANRSHPVEALKNTGYLKGIKKQFENWPFTLLIVNHLKSKTDDMGNTREYTLGGEAFNFHESFEIHNSVWKSKFKNAQFEGIGIRMRCSKNSFGPTGHSIKTRFLWWIEDDVETGEPHDVFLWDWNWSLCTLLNEMDGIQKQRLKDRDLVIKCKSPTADIDCLANFPAVGMGKDEYLPFQEVGQLIQDNHEVSERIRDALNIKRRYQLDRPYDEIVKGHKETAI
jgi:RecA/RadA recombinase